VTPEMVEALTDKVHQLETMEESFPTGRSLASIRPAPPTM